MDRKRTILAALLLAMLTGGAGWAHSLTYESDSGALFSFSMPRGWAVRVDGARVVAAPADASMWFGAWKLEKHERVDKAVEDTGDYLSAWFQDVKIDPVESTTVNGMPAHRLNGTAVYSGNAVRFSALVFEPKPKAICMALGVWDDETQARVGPIEAALGSLRPVPGG